MEILVIVPVVVVSMLALIYSWTMHDSKTARMTLLVIAVLAVIGGTGFGVFDLWSRKVWPGIFYLSTSIASIVCIGQLATNRSPFKKWRRPRPTNN